MASELDELRDRSAELGDRLADAEALEVNAAILALAPGDPVATNRLGIGLLNCGEATEAITVLRAGLRIHPDNPIMRKRLLEAEKAEARPARRIPAGRSSSARGGGSVQGWTDFAVDELVEGALTGPGRDACVRLCAESILAAEAIDSQRTAVTPIKQGRRFRTIGGIFTGVGPWRDLFTVAVPVSARSAIRAVEAAGGSTIARAIAVPSVQLGMPRAQVEALFDTLLPAHREHLRLSIAAGSPTHLNKHHPGLRQYLLDQARLT